MNWSVKTTVEKWDDEASFNAGVAPAEVDEFEGNLLMNAGITRMLNLLVGAGGQALNAANSRVGVGDSSTAASAGQTDLQAASNKYWRVQEATFPSVSGQTVTWKSSFGASEANFAWEEWAIDAGTTSNSTVVAPMLNRKVQAMGTKANPAVWTLTVSITIS